MAISRLNGDIKTAWFDTPDLPVTDPNRANIDDVLLSLQEISKIVNEEY